MTDFFNTYDTFSFWLQITASILTVISIYLMGNKSITGPIFGIFSNIPWFGLMFVDNLWGLLPANILILSMHIRNTYKWKNNNVKRKN